MPDFPDFDDIVVGVDECCKKGATIDDELDDNEDCIIIGIQCQCLDCAKPIPPAGIGGQRLQQQQQQPQQQKQQQPRRRLNAKTSPSSLEPPAQAKATTPKRVIKPKAKAAKGRGRIRMQIRKPDSEIVLPVEIVKRAESKSRPGEAYILQNTRKASYVVGCSSRAHINFTNIIELLGHKIKQKEITKHSEAKLFVEKYITGECLWQGASP